MKPPPWRPGASSHSVERGGDGNPRLAIDKHRVVEQVAPSLAIERGEC